MTKLAVNCRLMCNQTFMGYILQAHGTYRWRQLKGCVSLSIMWAFITDKTGPQTAFAQQLINSSCARMYEWVSIKILLASFSNCAFIQGTYAIMIKLFLSCISINIGALYIIKFVMGVGIIANFIFEMYRYVSHRDVSNCVSLKRENMKMSFTSIFIMGRSDNSNMV